MRLLLKLLLRLFPQDAPGIDHPEMEETFLDAVRGRPLSVPRELFSLLRHGTAVRLEGVGRTFPAAGIIDDVRAALKAFRRRKAFVFGAVAMLALGIGVNTAVFSMGSGMSRVVQRFHNPDELVFLWRIEPGWDRGRVSAPNFFAWRDETSAFQEMGAYSQRSAYLSGEGEPARIRRPERPRTSCPCWGWAPRLAGFTMQRTRLRKPRLSRSLHGGCGRNDTPGRSRLWAVQFSSMRGRTPLSVCSPGLRSSKCFGEMRGFSPRSLSTLPI